MPDTPPPPASASEPAPDLDLGLAALFAGQAIAETVRARIAARGFTGLRFSHGFLVQRLVDGEESIAALAAALEVTQQAVSKTVVELERLGYVRRRPDPRDARVRLVALTDLGRTAVAGPREAGAAAEAELRAAPGARRVAAATRVLDEALALRAASAAVRARRVRPPA